MAKNVIITGASSGIGRATAQRFAAEGWSVCVTARREAELHDLVASLPGSGHLVCPGSYADAAFATALESLLRREWGRVDALVNGAGVFQRTDAAEGDFEAWKQAFDLMVVGGVRTTRVAVSLMDKGGRVVHVTSIHGDRAEAGASAYSMAKAALNQYCRAAALELAGRGILVNAIAPGFIDTPMSVVNGVNELDTPWFRDNYVSGHHLPLRRAGRPEEIAGVAWFLCGPDSSYLTGQVLTVDGGLTVTF